MNRVVPLNASKPVSRAARWIDAGPTGKQAFNRAALGSTTRISASLEAKAISEGRASVAATIATTQARKAGERVAKAHQRSRSLALIAALVGCVGLLGNLCGGLVRFDSEVVRTVLVLASTLAMGAPLGLACARVLNDDQENDHEAAVAAEGATRVAGFARDLGEAVGAAADAAGLSPAALAILNPLLDSVEQDAESARRREQTFFAYNETGGRNNQRLKPKQDRVIVTPADGRKLTARIIDVSMSGVAIETDLPGVGLGSTVVIGSRKAMAVRKLARGMAFQFQRSIPASSFDVEILL